MLYVHANNLLPETVYLDLEFRISLYFATVHFVVLRYLLGYSNDIKDVLRWKTHHRVDQQAMAKGDAGTLVWKTREKLS